MRANKRFKDGKEQRYWLTREVRVRGPFLSLADFVNRRFANDETGCMGAIEAEIEKSGINSSLREALPLDNQTPLPDYKHPDNIADATRMARTRLRIMV